MYTHMSDGCYVGIQVHVHLTIHLTIHVSITCSYLYWSNNIWCMLRRNTCRIGAVVESAIPILFRRGTKQADSRSDMYSFGEGGINITLYRNRQDMILLLLLITWAWADIVVYCLVSAIKRSILLKYCVLRMKQYGNGKSTCYSVIRPHLSYKTTSL